MTSVPIDQLLGNLPAPPTVASVASNSFGSVAMPEGDFIGGRVVRRLGVSPGTEVERRTLAQLDLIESKFPGVKPVGGVIFGSGEQMKDVHQLMGYGRDVDYGAYMGSVSGLHGDQLFINADKPLDARLPTQTTAATDNIEEIVNHEFGHHIHNELFDAGDSILDQQHAGVTGLLREHFGGLTKSGTYSKVSETTGSDYAGTNALEGFAESIARGSQSSERLAQAGLGPAQVAKIDAFNLDVQQRVAAKAGLSTENLPSLGSRTESMGKSAPVRADLGATQAEAPVLEKATEKVAKSDAEGFSLDEGMAGKLGIGAAVIGGIAVIHSLFEKHKFKERGAAAVSGLQPQSYSRPVIPVGGGSISNQARNMNYARLNKDSQRASSFLYSGTSTARNGLAVRTNQF